MIPVRNMNFGYGMKVLNGALQVMGFYRNVSQFNYLGINVNHSDFLWEGRLVGSILALCVEVHCFDVAGCARPTVMDGTGAVDFAIDITTATNNFWDNRPIIMLERTVDLPVSCTSIISHYNLIVNRVLALVYRFRGLQLNAIYLDLHT